MGFRLYESHATLWSCTSPHVCVLFVMCVGWASAIHRKKNVLSLFLLIPLAKLTNQNWGNYRHLILYPLQLRSSFPNDGSTLRPKVNAQSREN